MATVQARIRNADGHEAVLPVVVPDLAVVREFACGLHESGRPWEGEFHGWRGEYVPERAEPPVGSRLTFTPAEFCVGESGVWFLSLVWERGGTAEPVEFVDDSGLVRP